MTNEQNAVASERDAEQITAVPQPKLSDQLQSLMKRALESSGLTLEQVFDRMEVNYGRGRKSFIKRHSRETGRLLEDLGTGLQGVITCNIELLTGPEPILPEDDWANQFREIFAVRPIPQLQIAKRMDLPWPSFAAYFTSTKRSVGTRPKKAWLVSHFFAATGYRLMFAFTPDGTMFIPVPDRRGRPSKQSRLRLVHKPTQGEITETVNAATEQTASSECVSALLSIFGVQHDAHGDTSWEALRAAWRTCDSALPTLQSADTVSVLLKQAQRLHDMHDFVGACLLTNIAQVLLGTSGEEKEN
jgi:hypothetical protein